MHIGFISSTLIPDSSSSSAEIYIWESDPCSVFSKWESETHSHLYMFGLSLLDPRGVI